MNLKTASAAALSVCTLMSFPVQAETYVCELRSSGASSADWIPPKAVVRHDPKTSEVTVIDGLIDEIYGGPIEAKIAVNNAKRITYSWNVRNVPVKTTDSTSTIVKNMVYRLTIVKATLEARETMKPVRFQNSYRAKGKCTVK
ncbi:hypothetical protein J3R80_09305 [Aliiroseovarius sp. Z3]|uniref:hypothetical protein n=1 Tax=Aliiroseovarius sp. Z3 TaxID=2811402 RepID=UPI0023B344C4|nr:hypothetical protein [Aliiroseovarius sp. Z3]MDE9450658.1 hypothetical protein [Aliiroseovarius sp. Z3]